MNGKRGQSTVEFALVLPVFLGALLGLVAFSLVGYSYVTIQLAAREGASSLVHNPKQTIYAVRNTVCTKSFSLDKSHTYVSVQPPDTANTSAPSCTTLNTSEGAYSGWNSGDQVTVIVNYTIPLPTFKIPLVTGGGAVVIAPFGINATSVMSIE